MYIYRKKDPVVAKQPRANALDINDSCQKPKTNGDALKTKNDALKNGLHKWLLQTTPHPTWYPSPL